MKVLSPTDQHAQTARMNIHEIVQELNTALGPTLVATLCGSKDRKLPIKWAKPDGPEPSPKFKFRLMASHRFWRQLEAEEGRHIARAWFIGGNPILQEKTPLAAIRDDQMNEVARAVEVFLRGDSDI